MPVLSKQKLAFLAFLHFSPTLAITCNMTDCFLFQIQQTYLHQKTTNQSSFHQETNRTGEEAVRAKISGQIFQISKLQKVTQTVREESPPGSYSRPETNEHRQD